MKMTTFFKKSISKVEKPFRESLTDFVILGNHAFSIVEEPGFKQMIRFISYVEIPTRNAVKIDIIPLYDSFKTKLIEVFKDMNCNIVITANIWTSLSNDPYIAITAHFFRNGKLNHYLTFI